MDPTINMKPPKYVEQIPSKENDLPRNSLGSLFTNSDNLFSDTKARKVNDIVTVVITEEITQSSQASKKLNEANTDSSSFNANISGGLNLGGRRFALSKTGVDVNLPTMNSSRTFQGSGTQQRNEKFQTTVTARIVKILANGNYFISGSRELYVDGQKQVIQISGVIRAEDIGADNTIDSKYISDAKIAYKTEGDLKRYTEQNWFAKIWNALFPW
jgi:flagellar L-ring protein precursor FlgH